MNNQIIAWIANLLFIYGVWVLGNKNVKGFYAVSIANLLYTWQSFLMQNSALCFLSISLLIINIIGIYKWQFKSKKKFNDLSEVKYTKSLIDYYENKNV